MNRCKIYISDINDNEVTLATTCMFCGKKNTMTFANTSAFMEGFDNFMNKGMLVQYAFPFLNPSQREFFLTGNCSCIWGS